MAESIPFELREQAENLFIVEGLTLGQVAAETGISVQSLKRWSADEGWPVRRAEYREAVGEIRRGLVLLRKRLIGKALETLDPKDISAVAKIEASARQKIVIRPAPVLQGEEDLIERVREVLANEYGISR